MARRTFSNVAPPVALTAAVTPTATSLPVGSTSGYGAAPFVIGLERGSVREEVCLVTGLTATSFTVQRGYDGTQAVDHAAGAIVEHTVAAIDYREANNHVNTLHRLRLPHSWIISGPIALPTATENLILPFYVPVPTFQRATLVLGRHRIGSGTSATVNVQRNEADLTGWTGISVTTTSTTTDGPDVPLNDNDRLAIVVTAVSGSPANLTFTAFVEYEMVLD